MNSKEALSKFAAYTVKETCGKLIVIFDSHNMAFPVWGAYSDEIGSVCQLITFDSHSDTLPAFNTYLCKFDLKKDYEKRKLLSYKPLMFGSFVLDKALCIAASYLRNDEHIKAACDFGYLSNYTIITNDSEYQKKQQYDALEGYNCLYFSKSAWKSEISGHMSSTPIILDFDLDYFTKVRDFADIQCEVLNYLIKNSAIITIAREPLYFERCKEDSEGTSFTNDCALSTLLSIIENVLNN